jgi:hypothetical protein
MAGRVGSAGAVTTPLSVPPTQTCPELCIPSSAGAKVLNVPLAIAAVTAPAPGSSEKAAMLRVTVCGPPARLTVGVNPISQAGNACSSLDFQYGMHTVGSTLMSSSSIRRR